MVDLRQQLFEAETLSVKDAVQHLLEESAQQTVNTDRLLKTLESMVEIIDRQGESITTLANILYEIAPEYEIIETMAENEEERKEMVNTYMNHRDDWIKD